MFGDSVGRSGEIVYNDKRFGERAQLLKIGVHGSIAGALGRLIRGNFIFYGLVSLSACSKQATQMYFVSVAW